MDALLDAVAQGAHHRVGGGEIDRDLGSGGFQSIEGIADVDHGREVQVVRGINGPHHLGPHAACGSDDPYGDHIGSLVAHLRCKPDVGTP